MRASRLSAGTIATLLALAGAPLPDSLIARFDCAERVAGIEHQAPGGEDDTRHDAGDPWASRRVRRRGVCRDRNGVGV